MHDSLTSELSEFFSFRWVGDPYELYRRLRDEPEPARFGRTVVVSRYDDVRTVLQNSEVFASGPVTADGSPSPQLSRVQAGLSSAERDDLAEVMGYERSTATRTNGEEHRRIRGAVQRAFTPRKVSELRDRVQEITDELLDGWAPGETIDFIDRVAYRLPLYVILDIMGVPRTHEDQIHDWAMAIGANRGGAVPSAITPARDAFRAFLGYLSERIDALEFVTGNLLSTLLDAESEGHLTRAELTSNVINVLFAGHETTTNLLANGVAAMLHERINWELLRSDSSFCGRAVDETLRFEAPVQFVSRTALADFELAGTVVPASTEVIVIMASGDRDERHYADPDRMDISRAAGDHLAFGFGVHRCLGSFLGKMEGEIVFETMTRRYPDAALATDRLEWRPNRKLRGQVALPLRLAG